MVPEGALGWRDMNAHRSVALASLADILRGASLLLPLAGYVLSGMAIAVGVLPSVLRVSFSSLLLVAVTATAATVALQPRIRLPLTWPEIWLYSYWILFGLQALRHLGSADETIISTHLSALAQMVALYVLAAAAPLHHRWFSSLCATSAILAALSVLIFGSNLTSDPVWRDAVSYQANGLALLTLGLLALASEHSTLRISSLALICAACYANGARSEFVAILLIGGAYFVLYHRESGRLRRLAFLIAATVAAVPASISFLTQRSESRIANIVEIESDVSFIARQGALTDAIATLEQHPFAGAYASYEPGLYAHNLLSAWVDLGLIGPMILLATIASLAWCLRGRSGMVARSAALATAAAALLMLTTKVHYYPLLAFAVGLQVSARYNLTSPSTGACTSSGEDTSTTNRPEQHASTVLS